MEPSASRRRDLDDPTRRRGDACDILMDSPARVPDAADVEAVADAADVGASARIGGYPLPDWGVTVLAMAA